MFTKKEKTLLALMAGIQFNHIIDFMIMMPLGPVVMRQLDMTPAQFGFVISCYTFAAGIIGFLGAFLLDRFDRKRVLLVLNTGFAIGTLLCAISPNFFFLALARATAGAFGGVMASTVLAIVGDSIAVEKRGTAMGIIMAAFSAASVLGVPTGLFLATSFSWHAPFVVLGCLALTMNLFLAFLLPPINAHLKRVRTSQVQVVKEILSSRETVSRLVFMALLIFGQFTVIPFLSPSLVANAGLPEAQLPLVYLVGGFFTIFTGPAWGRLSDRFGFRNVALVGITLSTIPLFVITHLPPLPVPLILTVSAIMFILMGGRMIPTMTMMTTTVPPEKRGSFMSLVSCVQQLTSAVAASTAGAIVIRESDGHIAHFDTIGWIAVVASAFALALLYQMKPVKRLNLPDLSLPQQSK